MKATVPPDFASLDVMLQCLDLEALDADLYLGDPGPGQGRLFGGMVAAQSVMAACRTVSPDRELHSLHAYFLRPGRHDVPLRFVVDRIRDGRTYTTRRVKAHQAGEAIFSLETSFARTEEGISHGEAMPEAPPPEDCEDWEIMRARLSGDAYPEPREGPLEVRVASAIDEDAEPRQQMWIRMAGDLPEDPRIHTAMLVYLSDRGLLSSLIRRHVSRFGVHMGASLDHALWIHQAPRFEGWVLYDCVSPASQGGRGICMGGVWDPRSGSRIATVMQEGLMRLVR